MITKQNLLKYLTKLYPKFAWNIDKIGGKNYKSLYVYIDRRFIFSILTEHKFTPELKETIRAKIPYFLARYSGMKITCKLNKKPSIRRIDVNA